LAEAQNGRAGGGVVDKVPDGVVAPVLVTAASDAVGAPAKYLRARAGCTRQKGRLPMFTRKSARHDTAFEVTKTDEEWKADLTRDRYAVLRRAGTEPAWSGDLLHVDGEGVFHCAGCGAELFDTRAKFESGTGWPSFDRARSAGTVIEHKDRSFGMARTEILCARCGGHLGHVFPDGPTDTGRRYCVNSLSLTYEPEAEPEGEGEGAASGA
jgi:peptide-methionine (R)-S-oxide reductase